MRIIIGVLLCFLTPLSAAPKLFKKAPVPDYAFQSGDIVFQATGGNQCRAIRAATHSPYSHCGVVFLKSGKLYVLEAISPVVATPLKTFRNRSLPGTFTALRLKNANALVTQANFNKADQWAQRQLGKPYDGRFLWSDHELYCSELVWKLFKEAGNIELCPPRRYDTFDLSSPLVRSLIVQRFGSMENFPAGEPVVPPSALATSPLLEPVPRR